MSDEQTEPAEQAVHAVITAMAPRPAELTASTRLVGDLAYDSVRLIELAMALETHFALPPLEESGAAATVTTVGDVVALVTRLRAGSPR